MSVHVLDASAMVAYLSGEPGSKVVDALLRNPNVEIRALSVDVREIIVQSV